MFVDLCVDSVKAEIRDKLSELLAIDIDNVFPTAQQIQEAAAELHNDTEAFEVLFPILRKLTDEA